MSRPDWATYWLMIARVVSMRATCARRRVGCVLTDRHQQVLATGYNGPASKLPHCIDQPCSGARLPSGTGLDLCEAIHAEQNALLQHRGPVQEIENVYCTTSPCIHCTKLLLATSAKRVYFLERYVNDGHSLWTAAGREWVHWNEKTGSRFPLYPSD